MLNERQMWQEVNHLIDVGVNRPGAVALVAERHGAEYDEVSDAHFGWLMSSTVFEEDEDTIDGMVLAIIAAERAPVRPVDEPE